MPSLRNVAKDLAVRVSIITASAKNEVTLVHGAEDALRDACLALHIPWYPVQLDEAIGVAFGGPRRFVDVAHGSIVIEYERPRSFGGREGEHLHHAKGQAVEYATLMAREEGRETSDYSL